MKSKNSCVFLILFIPFSLMAGNPFLDGLQCLKKRQVKESKVIEKNDVRLFSQVRGEWPSEIDTLHTVPGVQRRGYHAPDSNLFTPTSVHNILAEIYLDNSGDSRVADIPEMMNLAQETLQYARDKKGSYNFFYGQEAQDEKGSFITHGPNHYDIKLDRLREATNVPPDVDTSSVAYLSQKLYLKAAKLTPGPFVNYSHYEFFKERTPSTISQTFTYIDTNNRVSRLYNIFFGDFWDTHAFLTWVAPDEKLYRPREFISDERHQRIPGAKNDVDCVVNANVLRALGAYNEIEQPRSNADIVSQGIQGACAYIQKKLREHEGDTCGFYYPNPFLIYYATAKAHLYTGPNTCLEGAYRLVQSEMRNLPQRSDGSFYYKFPFEDDQLQATLFALNALLRVAQPQDLGLRQKATAAIRYVLHQQHYSGCWTGGIYFSAGSVIRKSIVWKSDAYTTALALEALSQFHKLRWDR